MTGSKIILISVYCTLIQHGYHVFCSLIPKEAVATKKDTTSIPALRHKGVPIFFVLRQQIISCIFLNLLSKELLA